MFAFILSIFGGLSSLILLPIGFAISVYAPLVIADTANWLYNTLGLNNFAYSLFGSSNWVSANLNTVLGQFFIWVLVAALATFAIVIMIRGAMVFTGAGKRWSIGLGRLTYGILGIVGVPIVFMFTILVTSTLFQAITPSASFITAEQLQSLKDATRVNDIQIQQIMTGTVTVQGKVYTYKQLMDEILANLAVLQKRATNDGPAAVSSEIDNVTKQIAIISAYDSTWFKTTFESLGMALEQIRPNERASNTGAIGDIYTKLADAARQYEGAMQSLKDLANNSSAIYYTDETAWQFLKDASVAANPTEQTAYLNSFAGVFASSTVTDVNGNNAYLYKSIIAQELDGTSAAGAVGYVYRDAFTGLDELYSKVNPLPQFAMTKLVYQYVTGSSSSNIGLWGLVGSGFTSIFGRIDRYVVGILAAGIVSGGMMAYTWYMIGRIFELIFFWLVSIFIAFTDDAEGARFKTTFVLIINKTFSIVVVQLVFTIVNSLINAGFVSDWLSGAPTVATGTGFDVQRAGVMMATAMVFAFGYPIADTLCGVIFGEPGKLRTLQDQYERIQGTGRGAGNYGKQAQNTGRSAVAGARSFGGQFADRDGNFKLPSFKKAATGGQGGK